MSVPEKTARDALADSGDSAEPTLYEVLTALGFTAHERVSINTKHPRGPFKSVLYKVRDLEGWSPPQDRNVWFGVNPVGRHVRSGRGTEADVSRVRALFADLVWATRRRLGEAICRVLNLINPSYRITRYRGVKK